MYINYNLKREIKDMKKTLSAILAVTMVLSTSVTAFASSPEPPNPPPAGNVGAAVIGDNEPVIVHGQILCPTQGPPDLIQITMPFAANWIAVPNHPLAYAGPTLADRFWGFNDIASAVHVIRTTRTEPINVSLVSFLPHADTNTFVDSRVEYLRLARPNYNLGGDRIMPENNAAQWFPVDPLIDNGVLAGVLMNSAGTLPQAQLMGTVRAYPAWNPAAGNLEYIFTGTLEAGTFTGVAATGGAGCGFADLTTTHNMVLRFTLP